MKKFNIHFSFISNKLMNMIWVNIIMNGLFNIGMKGNMLVDGFISFLDQIISKVVFLSEFLFNAQFKVCYICIEWKER